LTQSRWRAFALALLVLVLDGVDIQVLGLVAPSLVREWGVTRAALGPAMSAALVGMAIGAPLAGALGDRYGRRIVLLGSVAIFGVLTLATAATTALWQLTILRLLAGLGFGGALPNATALVAEFFPGRVRALAVAGGVVGVPIGGIAGAAIAGWLLPHAGWRALLLAGGALPLVLLALLAPLLPESPSFVPRHAAGGVPRSGPSTLERLQGLLVPRYRRNTLVLWPAFFASLFTVYAFFNWIPVMLVDAGLSAATATRGALVFNLGGLVGVLFGAAIMLRYGLKRTLIGAATLGLVVSAALARSPWHLVGPGGSAAAEAVALVGLLLAGVAVNGVQICLYALSAASYASDCRATGVGWALGCGRLGSITSAFTMGLVFAAGLGVLGYFVVVCAMIALLLGALVAYDETASVYD
jgi:AAHS family 4-hydroxybenzoate transporter-like MFS transporter